MAAVSPASSFLLEAIDHAIAVVGNDWRFAFVNQAWTRVLDKPGRSCIHGEIWSCCPIFAASPAPDMLRATAIDGATRRFDLEDARRGRKFGVRVTAAGPGQIVIELSQPFDTTRSARDALNAERQDEGAAFRALARHVVGVTDVRALFTILCEAAQTQCRAQGAAIVTIVGEEAELAATAGSLSTVRRLRFPIEGSLAEEVIRSRGTVMIEGFMNSARPLAKVAPHLDIGPMLAVPLVAHDHVIGALAVMRKFDALGFTDSEAQKLRGFADYAALALWKAEILEKAQAADRAKSRFLATVSHELRTPLTALAGYEELLADEVLGPLTESQADVLERMRSVTHHLTSMIEEVLAFSSLETGRERVRSTEFLAADLARAACAVVEPLARQKKLELICDVPEDPIRMHGDVDKIRQILVNLAGNAVKFTDAGEVRLALAREGSRVRFMVCDTGIGIAHEDIGRLFQPFVQLDAGLTRRHGGTGLGLYISQRLASILGGSLRVSSAVGKGSVFTLTLPVG